MGTKITIEQLAKDRLREQLNHAIDEVEVTYTEEAESLRLKMQIVVLICIIAWLFSAMSLPIIVFIVTKSLFSFSLFSTLAPPVYLWYRLSKYLFPIDAVPIDDKRFELQKLKIQNRQGKRIDWHNRNS